MEKILKNSVAINKMIILKKKSLSYVVEKKASASFTMDNMTKCGHLGATFDLVFRNLKLV